MFLEKQKRKNKWKYIFKMGLIWAIVMSITIHLIKILTGEFAQEIVEFSTEIPSWIYNLFAILSGAVVIFPIGIIIGIFLWKNKKVPTNL
jgi:hypothetical protein